MKKLIGMLVVLTLFCNTQVVKASENNSLISNETINTYELTKVDKVPQNITPIYVENEEELVELINQLEKDFGAQGIISETISKSQSNNNKSRSTLVTDQATVTHTAEIFELNDYGARIVSDVNYTYSYWIAPEVYETTINYHDVYEEGPRAFYEVTYLNKSATANGATITVNVRGICDVYIGISSVVEGEIVMATQKFDKTYKINTGLD